MRCSARQAHWAFLCTLVLACGCRTAAVPLVNITGGGDQPWVWPYFVNDQPTVLAFWNTNEMQCLRDVPALTTLDAREGPVQLVTVVTGRDRAEINKWLREHRIGYVVLLDLEERLARQLGVGECPAYVFLGRDGQEIDRVTDIRLVRSWFDRPRWLEKAELRTAADHSERE